MTCCRGRRRGRALILALLTACFVLSGCAQEAQAPPYGTVALYHLNESDGATPVLSRVDLPLPGADTDPLRFLLDSLLLSPPEGVPLPFPNEVKLLSPDLSISGAGFDLNEAGVLTVGLSEAYRELSGARQTLGNACLTLSLCALPGIKGVDIRCLSGGESVEGIGGFMTAADFVDSDLVLLREERTLTLYFVNDDGDGLVREARSIVIRENESPYLYCMKELLDGPRTLGSNPIAAPGGDVTSVGEGKEEGEIVVNLTASFYENIPADIYSLTLQAIVWSLTELSDGQETRVRFLADNNPAELKNGLGDLLSREDFE